MIRLEIIFLVGVLVGFVVGLIAQRVTRMWLEYRDEQLKKNITKLLLQETLPSIKTKALLNELSKRDDILK